jgi:large subunit ribosomal protein L7/L12
MDDLHARVRELEALVDHLYARLNVERPGGSWSADTFSGGGGVSTGVRELVMRGDKIRAIKLYREETGCGLREAKQVIDGL